LKVKIIFDVSLLVLFAVMCNTNTTGTLAHEVLGLVYVTLIAVHLILNRKWVAVLLKGKLSGRKSGLGTVVNALLFIDFAVILVTGLRISHYLFRFADKAPTWVIMTHIIGGIIAALLVLTHVLLHFKVITKGKTPVKAAVIIVLTATIGYSMFGGVQGALHHGLPKDGESNKGQYENRIGDENDHQSKDGEKK
jgi:hypothetical protein